LICCEHSSICQRCQHWTTNTISAICCQREVCQMCQIICHGCRHTHCIDHCDANKCRLMGCCVKIPSRTHCEYNGQTCADCSHITPHDDMLCHPINHIKYCHSCFDQKKWVCRVCDMIVNLMDVKVCERCQKCMCAKHMNRLRKGAKYYCQECLRHIQTICDVCLRIYSVSDMTLTPHLNYCFNCARDIVGGTESPHNPL